MGAGPVATPVGYLGFAFLSFVVAVSVFACSQIATARSEELEGRVATMLALPIGRARLAATWRLADLADGAALSIAATRLRFGLGLRCRRRQRLCVLLPG